MERSSEFLIGKVVEFKRGKDRLDVTAKLTTEGIKRLKRLGIIIKKEEPLW